MLVSCYMLVLRLESFQRAASRPLEALRGPVDPTQKQPSKPHLNFPIGLGIDPHRPSSKAPTNRYFRSFPIHLSMFVHSPFIHSRIGNVLRCARISPRRALIHLG